jgi:hypothetical protein
MGGSGGVAAGGAPAGGSGGQAGSCSSCTSAIAISDTYISANYPTATHGASTDLKADGDDGVMDHPDVALFRFPTPLSGTVCSATVTLYTTTDFSPDGFVLHRVLEAWNEIAATWPNRTAMNAWAAVGCGEPSSCSAPINDTFGFAEIDGAPNVIELPIDVVQSWIDDSSTNFGIALKHQIGDAQGVGVYSREVPGLEPTLDYCVTP